MVLLLSESTLSDRIIAARQSRGWTQEQLAAAAGLSQPHISRIESGISYPLIRTLARIARALRVPLSSLLD